MRIFKYKKFAKFVKKQEISDKKLCAVVEEMESGIIHADLGGNLFKQRIARDGKGKRGSYRSIIIYRAGEKVFFVHGFLKSDEENISNQEAADFREMANLYLELEDDALDQLLKIDEFKEVMGYDKK